MQRHKQGFRKRMLHPLGPDSRFQKAWSLDLHIYMLLKGKIKEIRLIVIDEEECKKGGEYLLMGFL